MTGPTLSQQLLSQLQGAPMQEIAQKLGTDPDKATSAVSQALPMLMGALGNQASQPQGIQGLLGSLGGQGGLGDMLGGMLGGSGGSSQGGGIAGALGSMLGGGGQSGGMAGALGSMLGGGSAGQSGGIGGALGGMLGGMFGGGNEPAAAQPAAQASSGGADALLGTLFGGKQARAEESLGQASGLGSSGAHSLLTMLTPIVLSFLSQRFLQGGNDPKALDQALSSEQQALKQQGGGGMLNQLLDQNGDGNLDMNDLVTLGSSLLGGKR